MKTLVAFILFLSVSCGKYVGELQVQQHFNHYSTINSSIEKYGTTLTLSAEHSNGKGFMYVSILDSNGIDTFPTFTIVRTSMPGDNNLHIVNEVPTNEGMFELTTIVSGQKQSTSIVIKDWPHNQPFKTEFSRVIISDKSNFDGYKSGSIEYRGVNHKTKTQIFLKNNFYYKSN